MSAANHPEIPEGSTCCVCGEELAGETAFDCCEDCREGDLEDVLERALDAGAAA